MPARLAAAWCGHPHLRRGEAFSAWLHRCANANGVTDHTFAGYVFPGAQIWTRDIDRLADEATCRQAADAMGEDVARVEQSTLQRYAGTVFPHVTTNGWLPWVTPVGVFHRRRHHPGWAFCPACLRHSGTAYLRWRLAWSVICPRHACWLLDGCPRCMAPFEFHRIGLSWPDKWPCPTCGRNLAASGTNPPLHTGTLAAQQRLSGVLRYGVLRLGAWVLTPDEAFAGLRRFLPALWPASGTAGLVDGWPSHARRRLALRRCDGPFEHWSVDDRARALAALAVYLDDWPDRFVRDAKRAGMRPSRLDAVILQASPPWLRASWALIG